MFQRKAKKEKVASKKCFPDDFLKIVDIEGKELLPKNIREAALTIYCDSIHKMIKEGLDPHAQMKKQVEWYNEILAKDKAKKSIAFGIVVLNYERVLQQNCATHAQCKCMKKQVTLLKNFWRTQSCARREELL